jgi:hypothetical protein
MAFFKSLPLQKDMEAVYVHIIYIEFYPKKVKLFCYTMQAPRGRGNM